MTVSKEYYKYLKHYKTTTSLYDFFKTNKGICLRHDVDNSIAYNFVEKGSMLLIKEFPTREDLIDTKDNVQNL